MAINNLNPLDLLRRKASAPAAQQSAPAASPPSASGSPRSTTYPPVASVGKPYRPAVAPPSPTRPYAPAKMAQAPAATPTLPPVRQAPVAKTVAPAPAPAVDLNLQTAPAPGVAEPGVIEQATSQQVIGTPPTPVATPQIGASESQGMATASANFRAATGRDPVDLAELERYLQGEMQADPWVLDERTKYLQSQIEDPFTGSAMEKAAQGFTSSLTGAADSRRGAALQEARNRAAAAGLHPGTAAYERLIQSALMASNQDYRTTANQGATTMLGLKQDAIEAARYDLRTADERAYQAHQADKLRQQQIEDASATNPAVIVQELKDKFTGTDGERVLFEIDMANPGASPDELLSLYRSAMASNPKAFEAKSDTQLAIEEMASGWAVLTPSQLESMANIAIRDGSMTQADWDLAKASGSPQEMATALAHAEVLRGYTSKAMGDATVDVDNKAQNLAMSTDSPEKVSALTDEDWRLLDSQGKLGMITPMLTELNGSGGIDMRDLTNLYTNVANKIGYTGGFSPTPPEGIPEGWQDASKALGDYDWVDKPQVILVGGSPVQVWGTRFLKNDNGRYQYLVVRDPRTKKWSQVRIGG